MQICQQQRTETNLSDDRTTGVGKSRVAVNVARIGSVCSGRVNRFVGREATSRRIQFCGEQGCNLHEQSDRQRASDHADRAEGEHAPEEADKVEAPGDVSRPAGEAGADEHVGQECDDDTPTVTTSTAWRSSPIAR